MGSRRRRKCRWRRGNKMTLEMEERRRKSRRQMRRKR